MKIWLLGSLALLFLVVFVTAPGTAKSVSEDTDIIVPLNVRDPSALVMGPGRHLDGLPRIEKP